MAKMDNFKFSFLCNLIHAFQNSKELYLVMPFMEDGDMWYQLKHQEKGKIHEKTVRFYTAEIVLGLEVMHSLKIVYRDLKHDNILLEKEGHLRISYFGISGILRKDDDYTSTRRSGTFGYMAPRGKLNSKGVASNANDGVSLEEKTVEKLKKIGFLIGIDVYFAKITIFWVSDQNYVIEAQNVRKNDLFWTQKRR